MTWIRPAVLAPLLAASLAACGSTPSTAPATQQRAAVSKPAQPRPSAAATGPCAAVTTTTPIAEAPPRCAALWAPYGVTMVPPANLTDSTPKPAAVVNETRGAVSDAQARAWALAANAGSVWYRWADAHAQIALLGRLESLSLYSGVELQALASGDVVDLPDCDIFPTRYTLFPTDASAEHFFRALGESPSSRFTLVATFPGPCTVVARAPSGQTRTLAAYGSAGTTLFAGQLRVDPELGPVWFVDGAGTCDDLGAPATWCAR